jgi:ankyrin repeat protein
VFKKRIIDILTRLIPPPKVTSDLELKLFFEESLKSIAKSNGAKTPGLLIRDGVVLTEKYGEDPGFTFLFAHACFLNGKYDKAIELLKKHYTHVKRSKRYSYLFKVLYSKVLSKSSGRLSIPHSSYYNFSRDSMGKVISKREITVNQGRELYFFMRYYSPRWKTHLSKLKKAKYEPWLINLVQSEVYVSKFWNLSGSGWPNNIALKEWQQLRENPDEPHKCPKCGRENCGGWERFRVNLKKASDCLHMAWVMNPNSPEVPALMVKVIMAGYDPSGEKIALWFNRAVAVEVDYMPAYYQLLWALRPRWGGSYKSMIELGEKALASKRYDTLVPLFYIRVLCDIAGDMPGYRWRSVFMEPLIQEKLETLFDGLSSQKKSPVDLDTQRSMQLHFALFGGDYSKAQELYKKIPRRFGFEKTFHTLLIKEKFPLNKALIKRELHIGTTFENELKYIYALINQGDVPSAVTSLELLLDKLDKDDIYGREFLLNEIAYTTLGVLKEKIPRASTGLRACVRQKDFDLFESSLRQGAPLTPLSDTLSFSPLHSITRFSKKDPRYLEAALKYNPDVDACNNEGWAPLHNSVRYGSLKEVQLLIGSGANLNAVTHYSHTPLHYAAWKRDLSFVRELIKAGANPNCKNNSGMTPLMRAFKAKNSTDVIEYLIENTDLKIKNKKGETSFYYAARYSSPPMIAKLAENGGPIDERSNFGWAPMHCAISYRNLEIITALIENGADIEVKTKTGSTPLLLASTKSDSGKVKLLVDSGANTNAKDDSKRTALYYSLEQQNLENVMLLIKNGAKVDEETQKLLSTKRRQQKTGDLNAIIEYLNEIKMN